MRFPSAGHERIAYGDAIYSPIKGIVMKTERVPGKIGVLGPRVQISGQVKAQHGNQNLLPSCLMLELIQAFVKPTELVTAEQSSHTGSL